MVESLLHQLIVKVDALGRGQELLLKVSETLLRQNAAIIKTQRREIMDITAMNTAITDLGAEVDLIAVDFEADLSTLTDKLAEKDQALAEANQHLETLAAQEGADQQLISQLRDALANAGSVDLTDQVNSLNGITDKLRQLDQGLKSAQGATPTTNTNVTGGEAPTTIGITASDLPHVVNDAADMPNTHINPPAGDLSNPQPGSVQAQQPTAATTVTSGAPAVLDTVAPVETPITTEVVTTEED